MMNALALVMEEDEAPSWRLSSMEDAYQVINHDFADILMDLLKSYEKMEDFVFAVDLLADMMETPYFPSDRMLDNPDITFADGRALNRIGLITRNLTMCGVIVTRELSELITEFLDDYLKLIHDIVGALHRPFITFQVNGVTHELVYYRQIGTVAHIDCLRFTRSDKPGMSLHLPFNNSRVC